MTTRFRWRRWSIWLAAAAALAVVVWLGLSYVVAYRFTRRAQPMRPEPVPEIAWGRVEPLWLRTADGVEIGAWFIEGRADRLPVLLLHGNGGCRRNCLPGAELAASARHPVMLISLRAHGDSEGEVNDFGYSARRDVAAAVQWLATRCPGRPVVLWGESLGAAAAIFAAEDVGGRAAGYLLECPYQDLRTAVRNRTRLRLPPVLDAIAAAGLETVGPLVLDDVDRISPLEAIPHIPASARVLILAGGADRHARPDEARALHQRCGGQADLVVIEGAPHGRLARPDPARYRTMVLDFLERCRQP